MQDILRFEERPFSSIDKMNLALIRSCNERAKPTDTIVHLGDLYCFKQDRDNPGMDQKPVDFLKSISPSFVNIRGNHDLSNKVFSVGSSIRTTLGKRYVDVSASHYPSFDERARHDFLDGDIHLCGHVHRKFKHCLDLDHQVLNINVGVDRWNFQIIRESELIVYIDFLLKKNPKDLFYCKRIDGKVRFFGTSHF